MIHVFVTSHGGMAEGILESVEMLIGKQENLTAITFGKEMGVDELSVAPYDILPLRKKVRSLNLSEK